MTFSLAGRCARTGMFGVVVTTSSIAVGSRCLFAKAGTGASLTQHRTDPRLGPLAIELLDRGFDAVQAMDAIVAATPDRHWRQLAIIDRDGKTSSFRGNHVKRECDEVHGQDCVALANIVRNITVPRAMVEAFEADPSLPLATRLLCALKAGEDAGSEFEPLVSAALLVVHKESFPFVDLRVDALHDPIKELSRLWRDYEPLAESYVERAIRPEGFVLPPKS
ncbi:MAG: DUF1028 domain-containing protein [Beijerinckiaceae bacterium]|nr:DUF1028 domain-containing protein [Beijerinckiaceae bacterium]